MDKYTYNIKMEKIQKLVRAGDYQTAARVADTVEWEEVRSVRMLTMAASAYEGVGDYKLAIDLLLMAYEESAVGKRILYKLTGLAIADRDIARAEGFYKMYLKEAPEDHGRYLLRYLLAELRNEPADKKIAILETYCRYEPEEDWMYRLAELYHRAGMRDKCIAVCDQIILWFSIGETVERAMRLKELYEPLSDKQLDRRENREYYESRYREVVREFEGEDAFRTAAEPAYEPEPAYETEAAYEPEAEYEPEPVCEPEAEPAHGAEAAYEPEAEYGTEPVCEPEMPHIFIDEQEYTSAADAFSGAAAQIIVPERTGLEPEEQTVAPEISGQPETSEMVRSSLLPVVAASKATGIETAIEALDQFCGMMGLDMPGVSKISAGRFNVRGVAGSFARIRGKAVLVEEAIELTDELLRDMSELTTEQKDRVIFLLLDRAPAIAYLQRRMQALGLAEAAAAEENDEAANEEATPAFEPGTEVPVGFEYPKTDEVPEGFEHPKVDEVPEGFEHLKADEVPEGFAEEASKEEISGEEAIAEEVTAEEVTAEEEGLPGDEPGEELPTIHIESVREDADMPKQVISHEDDGYVFGVDALFCDEKDDFSFNDLFKMQAAPALEKDASRSNATAAAASAQPAESVEEAQSLPEERKMEPEKEAQPLQEESLKHVSRPTQSVEKSFREEQEDIDEFLDAFVKATEFFVDSREDGEAAESVAASRKPRQSTGAPDAAEEYREKPSPESGEFGDDDKASRVDDMSADGAAHENIVLQGAPADDEEMPDEYAFIDYIKSYIDAIDCVIDEMGMLAIHRIVDNMQEDGSPLTKKAAEDMIEAAADRAEKKSMGSLFSRRYDREGRLILREKHFD